MNNPLPSRGTSPSATVGGHLVGVVEYQGNVSYCYADAMAMFVSTHGISGISSGLIEVLTGITLLGGHRVSEPECEKLYFSTVPTPQRLTKALNLLGLECETESGPGTGDPVELLSRDLATGPVMLGPLDMGYLRYFPYHQHARGADHYLVAYAMDEEQVYVHNPLGYPCATLGFDDLARSWRAENLPCPGGPFHRWRQLRRTSSPSPSQIYAGAAEYFESVRKEVPSGVPEILRFAEALRAGELSSRSLAFLTVFSFSAQARRGLDHANFFKSAGDLAMAAYKLRQAEVFGGCLQAANVGDWAGVADRFQELAELEELVAGHSFVG
jgi:hypothetical protein